MKALAILSLCMAILMGCTANIEYRSFVGDAQVLKGSGGACDTVDGVEIWVKGAPSHPFKIIGYIDGEFTDDIGEASALKRLIVQKVREVSGNGVIHTSRRSSWGDSYWIGNTIITDTEVRDEYVVFKYLEE